MYKCHVYFDGHLRIGSHKMVGSTSYSILPTFNYGEQKTPRLIYKAGDIALERGSPEVDCCAWARKFRVYKQDGPTLVPRGICCRNCNAEYLDVDVYNSISYHQLKIEVIILGETSTILDTGMDNCNISREAVSTQSVILRRKRSKFKVNRFLAWISMVQPHRRYINHRDPRAIDELRPGDHIAWHRSYTIWHHQLIRENKGNGKCDVIHFHSSNSSWCSTGKAEIKLINDFDFTGERNGSAYKILYDEPIVRENPVDLVFDRANSRLLEQNYNIFVNYCEHFVTFCKTGKQKSIQTIWLRFQIFFLILRAFILCEFSISFPQQFDGWFVIIQEKFQVYDLILYEGVSFLIIGLWNQRLYRKMVIGKLDRNRRILEVTLETFFTICVYSVNIGLLYVPFIQTFISEGGFKILTLCGVIFTIFVVIGKITGCLAGNYLSKFMKMGIGVTDPPRERPPMYGAVTVNS